jgi:hypothetical protein
MVLMMARQEAGPCERWPKMLKGELEKTLERQGPSLKTGIVTALKVSTYSLSGYEEEGR